jgi:hypothetical protein
MVEGNKLRKLLILSNLPRMDSNHDKVIQSHLCYRYTTRQLRIEWSGSNSLLRNEGMSTP